MTTAEPAATGRLREYETIYVLRPDVTRENAERVATRVREVVSREGGTLTFVETWGRRALAYKVGRYRRGVYVYFKYLGQGVVVSEIERNLRMLDDVIKYQTVKLRDDVDSAEVTVDPEAVKFEAVEPSEDDEEEYTLARSLGLDESSRDYGDSRGGYARGGRGDYDDGDGGGDESGSRADDDGKEDES